MWRTINQRLDDHAAKGHTLDEVVAAAPTKEFDAAMPGVNAAPFLRQAYGGITQRNAR
jgi:hypothetical protein